MSPRLLQCYDCLTLEKLPDFKGDPRDDVLLDDLLERSHRFPNGEEHRGQLYTVDQKTWDRLDQRTAIEKKLWEGRKNMQATRDTYTEDALKCYSKHGRPKDGCSDFHDDKKRIGNPTKEGWKSGRIKVYLCDFCPIRTIVETKIQDRKGMYK